MIWSWLKSGLGMLWVRTARSVSERKTTGVWYFSARLKALTV